jgi:hypothetical protein
MLPDGMEFMVAECCWQLKREAPDINTRKSKWKKF